MIPSTSSQLTLSNVSLATTGYFTCTVTGRDIPIKEDYDAKHVTIAVPPDDPPTITEVTKWAMELNQSCPNLPLSSISAQLDQGHIIQVSQFKNFEIHANESPFFNCDVTLQTTFFMILDPIGHLKHWPGAPNYCNQGPPGYPDQVHTMNLKTILMFFHFVVQLTRKFKIQLCQMNVNQSDKKLRKIFSLVQFRFK